MAIHTPQTQEFTTEELYARIQELEAEQEQLRAGSRTPAPPIVAKVSGKGGISVYGLGRFPLTLYPSQWHRLSDHFQDIMNFVQEQEDSLPTKAEAMAQRTDTPTLVLR